jgi:hypothetical protein
MTYAEMDFAEARRRMTGLFPSRKYHLLWQLAHYAATGQTFDVTFFGREPSLEVTLTQEFAFEFLLAVADGRVDDINRLCRKVCFSDGSSISLPGIWTINYMPRDLDISGVDLSEGEQRIGEQGETMREVISNTYRCRSRAEENFFLARFIAS